MQFMSEDLLITVFPESGGYDPAIGGGMVACCGTGTTMSKDAEDDEGCCGTGTNMSKDAEDDEGCCGTGTTMSKDAE